MTYLYAFATNSSLSSSSFVAWLIAENNQISISRNNWKIIYFFFEETHTTATTNKVASKKNKVDFILELN